MLEFFKIFLTSKQFIPHGYCYLWQSNLLGLHIISDSLIAIAYYSIPLTLLYFVRQRRDLPFHGIFLLFATFIITCGTTHLMEIWTLWYPIYWLSGAIKAIAALVSVYTAFEIIRLMPQALNIPSSAQLKATNQELEREISERQQVEAALRHSEERWHLAVAGTSEAIWDWDIPTNQTFRSERWYEILGYERHELSTNDDEWSQRIHPDDYEPVIAAQQAYLLQETPDYNVEYRLRRKDGNYGWFRSRAKAVWDEQGNPVRLVGSLGEITDRKQVELALQEREAMLRRIGDNLPNGAIYKVIRELDGSDRFYYLSAGIEKLMEVKAEDAVQDSSLLYSQFIPEDVPRLQAAVDESMRNLSVFDIQLRICTPSNQLKWFHFRSSPRQLEDGRVAWDGLVVDITDLKLTEEKLRKEEALLEESQRVARLGSWEYEIATGKITWSKGLFELFQRDPQLLAPSYEDNLQLYHPEDREKLTQAVARAISTGESYKLVLRATRSDNVEIYVEGIGYAEFNAQGEVVRLFGTAQDISERQAAMRDRKQAEAALQESERRFRGIFNNTFQFTGLLNVEGILLEANQTALNFAGIKPEDVINRPFWEAHWWTISPEIQEQLKQAIASAAQGNFIRYEVDVLGANNQVATIDFSLRPLQDESGQVILLIPEGRDITERQAALRDRIQAEEKLRRSEAQLTAAQHIAHVGSWEWNLGDERQIWSTETFRIFGICPLQLAPTQAEFLQMVHPDDRSTLQAHFLSALVDGTPINIEYRIIRADNSIRYLESRAEVAYDTQGNTIKLFGAVLDITERKQTELEIIKSRDLREAIFNESTDALFLVDPQTLLIMDCNHRAVELFAASCKADLIGIEGHTLQKRQFAPEELAEMIEQINQLGFWSQEIEYVTKQGNCFWGNIAAKEIRIAEQVIHLVRVADISDKKCAEAVLLEKTKLLDLAHDAIIIRDMDSRITCWNRGAEYIYGWTAAEAINNFSHQFLKTELSIPLNEVNAILLDLGYWEGELVHTRRDGEKIIAESRWALLRNADGTPVSVLEINRDISDRKRTQAALARSEEQQRLTLEFTNIGLWDWNIKTKEVTWNDNHFRLLGLEPETSTAQYQLWRDAVHPEDVERVEQVVFQALAEHTNFEAEYRVILPNGEIRWLTGKGRGIYDTANQPIRMLGVIFDISQRKQAEAALRESEARFQAFMDNSPALAWITDAVGHLIYFSQAYLHAFDLSPEQTFGKSVFEIFPTELAQQYFDNNQTVIQNNQVLETVEVAPRNDGSLGKFLVYKFPIPVVSTQKLVGGVAIDITERQRAEQMLELQAIITRNIAEGICLVRADDGIIVYANPKFEQMFGYNTDELIGQHISIVNYADEQIQAEAVNQAIRAAVLQNGEATYEVYNVKKDGTPFWCSATTSVFEHPEYGTVLVAVQQDITEQKQAEEQIKASLKEKEVLLKEIHHRVKNNLGIVSSLLQMQCRRTQDSQATAILRDSQNRIASIALVHEKLYRSADLANINFAQYIPDLTTHLFDSYNITPNCVQLKIQVDDASLDIETAIPCGLIINELVSNALKYAFPDHCNGEIIVSLEQQDNENLTLVIRDNGIGLPKDFDSKKTKTLGIVLVHGLVKQLRGTIEIDSQQGTEFKITFTKNRT